MILTRQTMVVLAAAFGGLSSFYLLISVVPLYLADSGAGTAGAGLATGVMMLATVLVELAFPSLLARLGHRTALGLGLLLFGAPALALVLSSSAWLVLAVCAVRGAGLGLVVVVGSALAAGLAPPGRRGEALAVYGVVSGVPAVIGVPAGIWLSERVGFDPVFVLAAVAALAPIAAVAALPRDTISANASSDASSDASADASSNASADAADPGVDAALHPTAPDSASAGGDPGPHGSGGSVLGAMRVGGLALPTLIFAALTLAIGVYATFLPLAVPADSREVAAIALLVQAVAMSVARLASGRLGDRHGAGRLLVPAVLASVAGAALAIWTGSPAATITGMVLFGAGFGVAQNVTLALMMERSRPSEYGRTSALWNLAYDAGFGVGAIGIGLLIGPAGYGAGFAITAAVVLAALVPAWMDHKWGR